MEGGSASILFFKKPFAKDIYKQHKQQDGRCVLFQYNFFFFKWREVFHRGKAEGWTLNTRAGILNQSHLLLSTKTRLHALHLQRSLSPRWRKWSHCMNNKTMSQFCSTKDLQALVAIITVWQWEVHHQTPIIGSHCFVNSTFECCQFPTIDLCKINPFHLRKKTKNWVTYEVAIYILPLRWSFFLYCCSQSNLLFFSHSFRTRRHFTLFTIYLTPGKWYISFVVFNVLPQW